MSNLVLSHSNHRSSVKSIAVPRSSMVISLVCHEMSLSSVWSGTVEARSMSLLYAEIVHGARGGIRFRFEVVSRTSFRSGDPIISVVLFHAWSCQSGLMVSRWNVRCLSDSSTDIYEVRTLHDIRSIHAIYLIVFPFTATTMISPAAHYTWMLH